MAPTNEPPRDHPEEPTEPDTIQHAIRAQQDADSASWGPLTSKIRGRLGRFRTMALPPNMEFDDFTAEVILRVLRDLPKIDLRSRGEFYGWLGKLADNTLTDLWRMARAAKRSKEHEAAGQDSDDDGQTTADPEGPEQTPSMFHRVHEIAEAERECASMLPTEDGRRAYLLRRQLDLPFEVIAERIGQKNAASARFVYFHAKNRVRACLRSKLETGYATYFRNLHADSDD